MEVREFLEHLKTQDDLKQARLLPINQIPQPSLIASNNDTVAFESINEPKTEDNLANLLSSKHHLGLATKNVPDTKFSSTAKIPLIKDEGKDLNNLSHKVCKLQLAQNSSVIKSEPTALGQESKPLSTTNDTKNCYESVKIEPSFEDEKILPKSKKRTKQVREPKVKNTTNSVKKESVGSKLHRKKNVKLEEPTAADVDLSSTKNESKVTEVQVEEDYQWWKETTKKQLALHPTWKWIRLEHQGVIFPPEYVPHNVKMLYDGKPVDLTSEQEEVATMFAKHLETQHGAKPQFCKNFFSDFVALLNSNSRKKHFISKFELCNFMPILEHLKCEAEKRKNRTKEEKELEKKKKNEIKSAYGFAIVDGHKEPLGNYMVEPPSLFLGRGDHPKTGHIKKRVYPEEVTLNISEDTPIPPCPIEGHKWGGIVHNHEVAWIATWVENISGSNKYVLFGASSSIRGSSDRKKFEVARDLMNYIDNIRETYNADLLSEDQAILQRATALWVIDNWALRIGNEKNEDEADTVGCCSLRVEHIKLHLPCTVELEFLGKDSMKYHRFHQVDKKIFKVFQKLLKGKKSSDLVFDQLKPASLNRHLGSLMKNLSAKVFRTYNASITLQDQLDAFEKEFGSRSNDQPLDEGEFRLFFNRANRQVAILCNHQRTLSKSQEKQMELIDQKIENMKRDRKILVEHLEALESGKVFKKKKSKSGGENGEVLVAAQKGDSKEVTIEVPVTKKKELVLPDNPEKVKKKIASFDVRLKKFEINRTDKGEGLEIQNSTSKINYIDPRITIAWCNKVKLDLKKVFSNTLLAKFKWAIAEVEENPNFRWKKGDVIRNQDDADE